MPLGKGQTSLGVRINKVFWYKGAVRQIKITPRPLEPKDFIAMDSSQADRRTIVARPVKPMTRRQPRRAARSCLCEVRRTRAASGSVPAQGSRRRAAAGGARGPRRRLAAGGQDAVPGAGADAGASRLRRRRRSSIAWAARRSSPRPFTTAMPRSAGCGRMRSSKASTPIGSPRSADQPAGTSSASSLPRRTCTSCKAKAATPGQSSRLQAAVVMAGPMELATGPVAERSRNQPEQSNTNRWLGKTIDEAPELYRLASPFTHWSKESPPILVHARRARPSGAERRLAPPAPRSGRADRRARLFGRQARLLEPASVVRADGG